MESGKQSAFSVMITSLFYIILWYVPNIMTVCLNKYIFQFLVFTYPLTLTAIHMLFSFVGSYILLRVFKVFPAIHLDLYKEVLPRVLPLSLLFCLNIVLGNVSIRWVPVSFMQTVKSSVPAFALLLQQTVFRKYNRSSLAPEFYLAMLPIVGGVGLASGTEVNFEIKGFLAAAAASFTTAFQACVSGRILEKKLDSVNLVCYMAPFSFLVLAPLALYYEGADIAEHWWTSGTVDTASGVVVLVISGLVALALNVTSFLVIANTSPLTFTVCGNFKVILSISISVMLFKNELTPWSGIGCVIAIGGLLWYNKLRYDINQKNLSNVATPSSSDSKV